MFFAKHLSNNQKINIYHLFTGLLVNAYLLKKWEQLAVILKPADSLFLPIETFSPFVYRLQVYSLVVFQGTAPPEHLQPLFGHIFTRVLTYNPHLTGRIPRRGQVCSELLRDEGGLLQDSGPAPHKAPGSCQHLWSAFEG